MQVHAVGPIQRIAPKKIVNYSYQHEGNLTYIKFESFLRVVICHLPRNHERPLSSNMTSDRWPRGLSRLTLTNLFNAAEGYNFSTLNTRSERWSTFYPFFIMLALGTNYWGTRK
jgi:hypothetical protein